MRYHAFRGTDTHLLRESRSQSDLCHVYVGCRCIQNWLISVIAIGWIQMMDTHHWSMSISNIKRIPKLWNISFPIGFQFSNCYWWISNMSISSNCPTGFHKETPKFPTSADKAAIARWTAKASKAHGIRSFSNTKVPLAEVWLMKYIPWWQQQYGWYHQFFGRSPYCFWWNHVKSLGFWGGEIKKLIPLVTSSFSTRWSRWTPSLISRFGRLEPGLQVKEPKNLRWKLKMSHFYHFVDESPKRSSHFHCQLTQENWLGDSRLRF